MQPQTPIGADTPTESSPVAGVTVGMSVVDSNGAPAGTVTVVQMPGTDVRPDTPVGVAEHLMATGYLRINGSGSLSNDTYAGSDQISGVTGSESGVVELSVLRDKLHRAAS
jgi:hypothetical protein